MGQRLNVEIRRRKDNKVLANSYYHWSAYTRPSLEIAKEVLDQISELDKLNDFTDEEKAVKLLQFIGGGLVQEDYDKLDEDKKKYFAVGTNRNNGLISMTEESMENTRSWEEGRITIDIDFDKLSSFDIKDGKFVNNQLEHYVDFEVYFPIDKETYKEWYDEELKDEDIIELDIKSLENMNYNDILKFLSRITDMENNKGIFKLKGKEQLYQIIY